MDAVEAETQIRELEEKLADARRALESILNVSAAMAVASTGTTHAPGFKYIGNLAYEALETK